MRHSNVPAVLRDLWHAFTWGLVANDNERRDWMQRVHARHHALFGECVIGPSDTRPWGDT